MSYEPVAIGSRIGVIRIIAAIPSIIIPISRSARLTISRNVNGSEVIEVMLQRHVNRLPVVRDGKLVGVITRHDLLKLIISNPDQS